MKEPYSKLDSTQKIVVKLFQQLVTEHTDRLHSLVQCTPPTGYRVYRPAVGLTALNIQCFNQPVTDSACSKPSVLNRI